MELRELTKTLIDVQRCHLPQFLAVPGVSAVGVGFVRVGGRRTPEVGIIVYVDKKVATNEIMPEHRIPRYIEGWRVDVRESRSVPRGSLETIHRPQIPCGLRLNTLKAAIDSSKNFTATGSAWKWNTWEKRWYLASVLHAFAIGSNPGWNDININQSVYQPSAPDVVALLSEWIDQTQPYPTGEPTLSRYLQPAHVTSEIHDQGFISAIGEPQLNEDVYFLGASTGTVSEQNVEAVSITANLTYFGHIYDSFELVPKPGFDVAKPGDSGAPVFRIDNGQLILLGMILTSTDPGAPDPASRCGKISQVERQLGVKIVTKYTHLPSGPSVDGLKARIDAVKAWVDRLVQNADLANQRVVKMYPGFPLALKRPNALGGEIVQHLGHYRVVNGWARGGEPYGSVTPIDRFFDYGKQEAEFFQPDGRVTYRFEMARGQMLNGESSYAVKLLGKPNPLAGPVELWRGTDKLHSDINGVDPGTEFSVTKSANEVIPSARYFIRTQNLPAAKLIKAWDTTVAAEIDAFSSRFWKDLEYDIYSPIFGLGASKDLEYLYSDAMWQDANHIASYPSSLSLDQTNGWYGYPLRTVETASAANKFYWRFLMTMDPLFLAPYAVHTLIKHGNPDFPMPGIALGAGLPQFFNAAEINTETLLLREASELLMPATPRKVANYIKRFFYVDGLGVTSSFPVSPYGRFDLIFSGFPERTLGVASAARTNLFSVLTTLLGHKYGIAEFKTLSDDLVGKVMLDSQWGSEPFRNYEGADPARIGEPVGAVKRVQFQGAQMHAWRKVNLPSVFQHTDVFAFPGNNNTVFELSDMSFDDGDYAISTVESTVSFAQALRVYLKYKHNVNYPNSTNLP
ncbi:MAG: hypothetical protein FJ319_12645 [SAR202 cluster bacterium]|nr:hypothetical protein [SAR202 cluster bacterium]